MWKIFTESVLLSYSQIFFTNKKWLAFALLFVSFLYPPAGLCGLLSIMICNGMAFALGFDKLTVQSGFYGFNALLVGLGLGVQYELNFGLFILLLCAALVTFLFTLWFSGWFSSYGLPMLSMPFVFATWFIGLAAKSYSSLALNEHGIYVANELMSAGGKPLYNFYVWLQTFHFAGFWGLYFKSLGAIFFQPNILAGAIISLCLLINSRIQFTLSILGFGAGWLFYQLIGGALTDFSYGLIGYNFILTALALSGFYLIPSLSSYVLVAFITPVTAIIIAATSKFMGNLGLPVLALPFNMAVMLVVYALKFRPLPKHLLLVVRQTYSPERNLYEYKNWLHGEAKRPLFYFYLPFYSDWRVSQAYDGEYTHKSLWRHALDFVVAEDGGKTYKTYGAELTDYYGFGMPVLAPADGYIEQVIDHVEDNPIGEVNLKNNWGNTVIIRHSLGLYTKISHLKQYSILVPAGQFVHKGDIIGYLGNSGRSPEPHIHFQVQASPYIDAYTMPYMLANYISRKGDAYSFHAFEVPEKDEQVSNVEPLPLLQKAFQMTLGSRICYEVTDAQGDKNLVLWHIQVTAANQMYLFCPKTQSCAYYVNDGNMFYFTAFDGDKQSVLFQFYLAANKLLLAYYKDICIENELPLALYNSRDWLWFEDFVAPFALLKKATFAARYVKTDNDLMPQEVTIETNASVRLAFSQQNPNPKSLLQRDYTLLVTQQGVVSWECKKNKQVLFTAKLNL